MVVYYLDSKVLITRYLSWRLLKSQIEMTAVFCSFLFVIRLMAELKRVGLSYTTADVMLYVGGMLPSSLARFDSMIIFLAVCMWFLQLRRSQELLIVQVSGVSMTRLIGKLLPVICLIITLFTINREYIAPNLAENAKLQRAQKVNGKAIYFQNNDMWLRTDQGFLNANIGQDAYVLKNVHYYLFQNDELYAWVVAPKVIYRSGRWIAPSAERFVLTDQGHSKQTSRLLALPISLKPRVLSWSFIKPEYLSAWQIGVTLSKGTKYGISDQITWLLFCVRVVRPLNLFLIVVTSLSVLDRAISSRFVGLSSRLVVLALLATSEFVLYALMCESHNALGFNASVLIAICPAILLMSVLLTLYMHRWMWPKIKMRLFS